MIKLEESLITRIRNGERKAMEELYDTYSPVLLGVAMRYCNSKEEAEDMLHESLLKILKGVKDFKPEFEGAFEAWMRRITVNQCLSFIRRRMNFMRFESLPNGNDSFIDQDEISVENAPDIKPEDVINMIRSLPTGYRTVLNLYVFERMTHKQIASELNISENTSKSQLSKARDFLKKKIVMLKTEEAQR
ncbi:MAG: RNA polymerase sigma factor [Omnitrophica WOR_2 bacterium]|jgi:RNA polymerase sigma-70 factor (ECF subfamily)